jgi:ferritin
MLSDSITHALNQQVELEGSSSQYYLAMASWAENNGLNGVSNFLYRQSDEEREHMLKLIRYINERGGKAIIPALKEPPREFESLMNVFEQVLNHELNVTKEINNLVGICLSERDYTTQNFLQWYVAEQIEEEALAKLILDKLRLIGSDKGGLYLFDRDLSSLQGAPVPKTV